MKGNDKVIEQLNELLTEELTAINQYMVHAEMLENWMYERLHEREWEVAMAEMRHAEKLIARVLFLEGRPLVSKLNEIHIGPQVEKQIENDLKLEQAAVAQYNEAIKLCREHGDHGSQDLLESILKEEEAHTDYFEAQKDQIAQVGIENYLAAAIRK